MILMTFIVTFELESLECFGKEHFIFNCSNVIK